ncbi:hypothetical protein LG198_09045 [Methylobacillus arboreus]|uniref:hypothetical protein n=1 Tax=Methylobacillus arboreus TaxID=755170 RepID=UPI001E2D37C8|nr:hypothetical protein [Methylobacillus arboreus]MCB5190871.1 hypothetical protein [Methylobacillus arboreus]
MNVTKIVCLPDLFKGRFSRQKGMFDLMREPILQGCGIDIAYPPTVRKKPSALLAKFDLEKFLALASDAHGQQRSSWAAPRASVDYLFSCLPEDALVLSVDMPPWLEQACADHGYDFINITTSPLRFARDLYIAVRCSNADTLKKVGSYAVKQEEIRLEAAALAANVRMHKALVEEEGSFHFDDLDDSLIYIGQAPYETSLQTPDGRSLRCDDFADRLQTLCQGRRLLYKGHPLVADFAQQERAALARITGQPVALCQQGGYQILSATEDLELTGISAEILQEAQWFGKRSHMLYQPAVPLAGQGESSCQLYQQVHFKDFLSPAFWHQLLAPARLAPIVPEISVVAHHHARETLDQWGDYSAVMTWGRTLPYESFLRSGGLSLIQRIESLEESAAERQAAEGENHFSRSGKLVILGNGPSLKGFDLHSLTGADTLGMNAAYRYWERVNWYPDHYVCLDDQLIETHAGAIHDMIVSGKVRTAFLIAKILNYYPDLRGRKNVFFLESFKNSSRKSAYLRGIRIHSSIPFKGTTSLEHTTGAFAVRYAAHMGYADIAILGVDLRYVEVIPEAQHAGGIKLVMTETPKHNPNYFFDDYQQAGDKYNIPNPGRNLHVSAFKKVAADRQAYSWKTRIFNSNKESVLFDESIFPFVSIEDFLRNT